MYSTSVIVDQLKTQGMDSEFYPTTDEIIQVVKNTVHLRDRRILDIGAGNASTLIKLGSLDGRYIDNKLFAIEKNPMLRSLFADNAKVNLVGVDFLECELWNKHFDVIFCNPPFSEFTLWTLKIINEVTTGTDLFLVLPKRWKDNQDIQQALKNRDLTATVLGEFNFLDAERRARAYVDLVRIKVHSKSKDLISRGIEELFAKNNNTAKANSSLSKEDVINEVTNLVVAGGDYVSVLCDLYNKERETLQHSILELGKVPKDILAVINVSVQTIIQALTSKFDELTSKYWQLVIDKVMPLSYKLIETYRKQLLDKISNSKMDFNVSNIYAMAEQVLLLVNSNLDQQVLSVYNRLINSAAFKYKSNQRVFIDNKNNPITPCKLSCRIITKAIGSIGINWDGKSSGAINDTSKSYIRDIIIIANNLGYDISAADYDHILSYGGTKIKSGDNLVFTAKYTGSEEEVILFQMKPYLNGNVHIKFDQRFMNKLNVIKGKLEGWIFDSKDVVEEFDVSEAEADQLIKLTPKITANPLLLGCSTVN